MHTFVSLTLRYDASMSLTEAEYSDVAHAVCQLHGVWCVQRDEDDHGHLAVSIMSDDSRAGDDTHVFLLARKGGRLQLDYGQADFYAGLGSHSQVDSAMATVRSVLEGGDAVKDWMEEL